MGGEVELESAKGEGSLFRVRLPLPCADGRPDGGRARQARHGRGLLGHARQAAQDPESGGGGGGGRTIASTASFCATFLEQDGHEVDEAHDGPARRPSRPAAVLRPHLDGYLHAGDELGWRRRGPFWQSRGAGAPRLPMVRPDGPCKGSGQKEGLPGAGYRAGTRPTILLKPDHRARVLRRPSSGGSSCQSAGNLENRHHVPRRPGVNPVGAGSTGQCRRPRRRTGSGDRIGDLIGDFPGGRWTRRSGPSRGRLTAGRWSTRSPAPETGCHKVRRGPPRLFGGRSPACDGLVAVQDRIDRRHWHARAGPTGARDADGSGPRPVRGHCGSSNFNRLISRGAPESVRPGLRVACAVSPGGPVDDQGAASLPARSIIDPLGKAHGLPCHAATGSHKGRVVHPCTAILAHDLVVVAASARRGGQLALAGWEKAGLPGYGFRSPLLSSERK